ncbi:MAG: hypothetical protein FJ276_32985, partial [Planctomycetes bacterium]|nr:hypothetical protein [Planctomycetota bacterium]
MRRQIIMAAMATGLAAAGAARGAGWPTNAYPPWQHVRQSRIWADCTYSAATERAAALGISGPAAPTWWSGLFRDSRPDLVKYKAWYRTNAVSFLAVIADPEAHLEAGWPISYTNLNPSGPAAYWPRVTLTGLLANASLPTNYFDYTPLRDLSGLGMFTNDTDYAATGRAYGHTNARTAAGGTVPTNRTAWRTTDYGWAGITSLAARLTATEIVVTPTTYATNSSYSNAVFYGGSGSPAGDWASACADAEANAINLAGERHPYYYAATFGLWETNGDHTATFHQQRLQNYWLSNSVFSCGIARSVDCYVFMGPWD